VISEDTTAIITPIIIVATLPVEKVLIRTLQRAPIADLKVSDSGHVRRPPDINRMAIITKPAKRNSGHRMSMVRTYESIQCGTRASRAAWEFGALLFIK